MDVEIDPLIFLGLAGSTSSSTSSKHRGTNFTEYEKRLLLKLVSKFPSICIKGSINTDLRIKKQQSWAKLTRLYNSTPNITQRTMLQLKTAWENSKRQARRSGGNSTQDSVETEENDAKEKDNEKQHDLDTIECKVDTKRIKRESLSEDSESAQEEEEDEEEVSFSHISNEEQAKMKRVMLNIRQDHVLFNLKRKRESIAIEREKNMLKYEKSIHELNLKKMELEIKLLTAKYDEDCAKRNVVCNGTES